MSFEIELDAEQKELFRASASDQEARNAWAQEFGGMLLQTVRPNGTVRDIFTVRNVENQMDLHFPIEPNDAWAYVVPHLGSYQRVYIEGDEVYLPVFEVTAEAAYAIRFARDANYSVAEQALQKLNDAIVRIEEEEGWRLLRAAVNNAYNNGYTEQRVQIANGSAGCNTFSKQLMNSMTNYFEKRGKVMTHLYGPAEMKRDIRNWTQTTIDDTTQREIFVQGGLESIWRTQLVVVPLIRWYPSIEAKRNRTPNTLDRLFDPNDVLESGSDVWTGAQQTAYSNGQLQVCYGLQARTIGIMGIRDPLETQDDPVAIKRREQGILAHESIGYAIGDAEDIIMGFVDRTQSES